MRLGMNFGYQDWGAGLGNAVAQAQEAERLGYDSVWTAEAYGTDCITPLTWLLAHTERIRGGSAIMQMPARTPAMTAMTAANAPLAPTMTTAATNATATRVARALMRPSVGRVPRCMVPCDSG